MCGIFIDFYLYYRLNLVHRLQFLNSLTFLSHCNALFKNFMGSCICNFYHLEQLCTLALLTFPDLSFVCDPLAHSFFLICDSLNCFLPGLHDWFTIGNQFKAEIYWVALRRHYLLACLWSQDHKVSDTIYCCWGHAASTVLRTIMVLLIFWFSFLMFI